MPAQFFRIKQAIIKDIESGHVRAGQKIASENQLAEKFAVSRMTARRAITELVNEGVLFAVQGQGTFVAESSPMSSLLEIKSIDDEIEQRGHLYTNQVLKQTQITATVEQAGLFGFDEEKPLYLSQIVHLEAGIPVQLEERWVNPDLAPHYLEQDFTTTTPSHYLNKIAPLTQADHIVESVLPSAAIASHLAMLVSDPCLLVKRRTYSSSGIVSYATLYHPGDRYRLGGHLEFK